MRHEPRFDAYWCMAAKSDKGNQVPNENQFYVCLKINSTNTRGPVLIFCQSRNFEWHDDDIGYVVCFDRPFFSRAIWCNLENLDLFSENRPVSYVLDDKALNTFAAVLEKICNNLLSDYAYKYDLIRTYLLQVIHLTIKLHIQTVDILKSPVTYLKLTTSSIDVRLRLTLGHHPNNKPST